jgi:hypothetical protein
MTVRTFSIPVVILLALPGLAQEEAAAKRAPVPDAAAQKESEKTLKAAFKDDYAKRAPADLQALARKLLENGRKAEGGSPDRYVLLREARDLASQNGDLDTAFAAITALAQAFEIDGVAMKTALLAKSGNPSRQPDLAWTLSKAYLSTLQDAVAAGQYDVAAGLVSKAEAAARGTYDVTVASRIQALGRDLPLLQREHSIVKSHRKTLEEKPDDPAANLAVGRFLCLVADEWEKGLPLLAKGSDAALKALAEKELAKPADAAAQAALGDGWWDQAEKEKNADLKKRLQARVRTWYELAAPGVDDVTKITVQGRLRRLPPATRTGLPPSVKSAVLGGPGGGPFEDCPTDLSVVVGLRVTLVGSPIIKSIQALYLTGNARTEGRLIGVPEGPPKEVVAKPGYAVAGLVAKGANRVDGFKVIFMKIAGPTLDTKDTYESEWIGGRGGGPETKLGGDGAYVIGIHGRSATDLDGLGLIQIGK